MQLAVGGVALSHLPTHAPTWRDAATLSRSRTTFRLTLRGAAGRSSDLAQRVMAAEPNLASRRFLRHISAVGADGAKPEPASAERGSRR